jgi:hypothetical protein
MRRPHLFFLTVLWLAFVCQIVVAAESARAFRLDARSHWTIEFGGPTKIEVIRFAAEQLDVGLSRMLGWSARSALIERKWADAGCRIRLVTGGRSPSLAGATPKMAPGGDEFRIETAPDVIEVTASNPASLLRAAYSLLETQGCHWLYPGAQGEVIPRKNELVFPTGQRGRRADLAMRGLFPVENLQRYSEREISELLDWMAKNGFNHLCAIQNYGWKRLGATIRREAAKRDIQIVGYLWSFERLLPLELGQEHPEYFALIKGQRQVNYNIKRCASSPEAIALFVKNGVRFLRDSELNQWLISPNDGSHWCQCDGCKKLLPKDQWAAFFAPLAQAVARELPTIRLQNFVYRNRYDLPLDTAVYASPAMDHYFDVYPRNRWFTLRDPDGPPDKIELPFDPRAAKFSNNAYLADRIAAWKSIAKGRIWLFENLMLHGTYSLPVPNLHLIADDLRDAAKEGLDGYLFEAYAQGWNSFASDFWALGRLCWDTSLDADRLQQEFFELLLGAKSSALGAFYRDYPRRIAHEMRGVATGGGPYGEVHWMHRMPQAAAAYTAAIRSIAPDGLSPAGQEWLLRQRQVIEIMDEIRHRSANPPVGILGTSKPDEILLLCEKALHATKGVDGIYFARWQLAGLFRRLYDGGQAEGCVLPNQFDAETRALFRDGKIWDTLAAWEDAGRFPRDPADPDREIREILLRAIRQARADLGAERKNP